MKVLLIDADSKIPNLALMKLSTYHKQNGDEVELLKLRIDYYPKKNKLHIVNADIYDKVYVSIIFQTNKDNVDVVNCGDVEYGGTGYDMYIKLPQEIDDLVEDYNLYGENETSYGFITRGCIRNCYFCFVPKKEGKLHKYRDVKDIVKFKKTTFMDNNILAYEYHKDILQELIDTQVKCSFNQGLDIRLLDDENARLLSKLKYVGEYFFAFDSIKLKSIIERRLALFRKYVPQDWKVKMFIYCNADMPIKETTDRINWCKENKVLPYLMRDINCWESENKEFYIDIASYCNQPNCFKKMTFEQFVEKRTKNKERIHKSTGLFNN